MKKKLLYLTSIALFSVLSVSAQKTWDFGTDTTNWPVNATGIVSGTGTSQKDLLNLTPHPTSGTNFGVVGPSAITFDDGYVSVNSFKTGGNASAVDNMPAARYFSFNVDAACDVKVWFRHGSGAGKADRTVFVTGGTAATLYGSGTATNTTLATPNITFTATVPAAGIVYVYANEGVHVYKIEVIGATVNTPALSTGSFQAESSVAVYANNGAINVSNVTSATKVSVYSVLGSLVKSIETSEDASIQINNGVYIVKAQSAEGVKTAKVIVQ